MTNVLVRRLTPDGIHAFAEWLAAGAPGTPSPLWISEESFATPVGEGATLDPKLKFSDRFQLGSYVWSRIGPHWIPEHENDVGMWSWLCLLYFDQLRPTTKPSHQDNYIYDPHRYSFYRHCVAMPTKLFRDFGDDAKIFISSDITVMGDMLEQCMSRQYLMRSKTFRSVVRCLYFDEKLGKLRPGASSKVVRKKTNKGAWARTGAGSVRRLAVEVLRLDLAFNLEAMTPSEMLALLGTEYDRFKQASIEA